VGVLCVGVALALALGCGRSPREIYEGRGRVIEIDRVDGQIRIAHEAIPGFMPAMTMTFDVPDSKLLDAVEPGAQVRFSLARSEESLRIVALERIGSGEAGTAGVSGVSGVLEGAAPAPLEQAFDFEATDQAGRPFALADHRGQAVLLDFIFTRCPGPCPILTSSHVSLQHSLPSDLAARTHFVSVTLDPSFDTPARLRGYAETRHANLESWSFVTASPPEIAKILDAYHVGSVRKPGGEIDHVVATFLIDPQGRIVRRYLGLEHTPEEILEDLRRALRPASPDSA
ncbi:MAG: SCO family protein, partial [Myxococcota bacterium]